MSGYLPIRDFLIIKPSWSTLCPSSKLWGQTDLSLTVNNTFHWNTVGEKPQLRCLNNMIQINLSPFLFKHPDLRLHEGITPLQLIPFNWSFPPHLTISRCPVCIRVFRSWHTIAKIGKACFYPFVDFIQHGSKVLELTPLQIKRYRCFQFTCQYSQTTPS